MGQSGSVVIHCNFHFKPVLIRVFLHLPDLYFKPALIRVFLQPPDVEDQKSKSKKKSS